jgi:hypothetical protein
MAGRTKTCRKSVSASAMARLATRGCLGAPMAAKTFPGIEPPVDAMPGQVVAAVGHQSPGIPMPLDRRPQPGPGSVAIGTKTCPVADLADPLAAHRGQAMGIPEKWRMFETLEWKFI